MTKQDIAEAAVALLVALALSCPASAETFTLAELDAGQTFTVGNLQFSDWSFDQIFSLANTRVGNRYLFGGRINDTAAFTRAGNFGPAGAVPAVAFAGEPVGGNNFEFLVAVGESSTIESRWRDLSKKFASKKSKHVMI